MYSGPVDRFLDLAGEMIRTSAVTEAPVRTGDLRGDITVFPKKKGEVSVGNSALIDYAKYVYYGTKPHMIAPKKKKALKTPFGVFKKVQHPGTKANPYLERAFESIVSSGRLESLLGSFATEMEEEMFTNISRGLKNIKTK